MLPQDKILELSRKCAVMVMFWKKKHTEKNMSKRLSMLCACPSSILHHPRKKTTLLQYPCPLFLKQECKELIRQFLFYDLTITRKKKLQEIARPTFRQLQNEQQQAKNRKTPTARALRGCQTVKNLQEILKNLEKDILNKWKQTQPNNRQRQIFILNDYLNLRKNDIKIQIETIKDILVEIKI